MSAPQWKPGDVGLSAEGERFIVTHDGACAWVLSGNDVVSGRPQHEDRPLVVIDPEDREQVERLTKAATGLAAPFSIRVDEMADALRSLIAPPKPDEPQGLGAVVEDADGRIWIHASADTQETWVDTPHQYGWRDYSHIDAVRVLSEGWSE